MTVILDKEGYTWFQSFKLTEEENKVPMVIPDHFAKSFGSASTYWIHQEKIL